jgi:hypothetical protein
MTASRERPSPSHESKPGQTARAFLDRWPAAAYMTAVKSWRELPGGEIEFYDEVAAQRR